MLPTSWGHHVKLPFHELAPEPVIRQLPELIGAARDSLLSHTRSLARGSAEDQRLVDLLDVEAPRDRTRYRVRTATVGDRGPSLPETLSRAVIA